MSYIYNNVVKIYGTSVDAFGRFRVGLPYTLFDGQSRFAADSNFDTSVTGGTASSQFVTNHSAVALTVKTAGDTVVRQTFRYFPYQPGKSLFTLLTFTLNQAVSGLTQRLGYFDTKNGVYLEQAGSQVSFVVRSNVTGSVDNSRFVTQANWNVDKFDGTGPSGITIDLTKTQILFFDFEWLGVGNVRCGFIDNGQLFVAHVFTNSNVQNTVYMTTAILPLRYEISTSSTLASTATMQQICQTVISEGGYEQTSQTYVARPTSPKAVSTTTAFTPIVSIRINSSYLGAVVIPADVKFFPDSTGYYEIVLVKNAALTAPTWSSTVAQCDVDTGATAMSFTADAIVQQDYASATNQGSSSLITATGFNWDLQLGVSLSNVSDTYTVGVRAYIGNSPTAIASLGFKNLTV
jgi:hypothetical protein